MKCENCNKEHNGSYGSGRFCSRKCARGFATKNKRKEINEKVSISIIKYWDKKGRKLCNCLNCGKEIHINKTGFCATCWKNSTEFKKLCKENVINSIKNGKHVSWQSRNIKSYPEKFFITVLKNNNIFSECIVEYPIKKSLLGIDDKTSCYFLDFYFPNKNIDLEIDGKQHKYEDRKQSDEIRDKLLIKHGIYVYRIRWKNINTDEGKQYIKYEIEKFLKYYSECSSV